MTSALTTHLRYALAFCLALAVLLSAPFAQGLAQSPTPSGITHTVTTLVDELDADADPNVGAGASLREILAYEHATGDRIIFHASLSGSLFLVLGELVITEDLILEGPGSDVIELNGNDLNRILWIDTTIAVAISGLTLTSGRALDGAAIWSAGWLSVTECAIRWSTAVQRGGAIYHDGTGLVIEDSRFEYCESYIHGGAVAVTAGYVQVDGSFFTANTAGGDGGALYLGDLYNEITQTTFEGNTALGSGGAIAVTSTGDLELTFSTLNNNRAANGGGINNAGTLELSSSTISGNIANSAGGGIRNSGTAGSDFSTIARNSAAQGGGVATTGSFTIGRTIVAENSASSGTDVHGAVTSSGTNLIAVAGGSSGWVGSDITGTSDKPAVSALDDLRLNGGQTKTHALLACSRAIDAASSANLPATDQRGESRNVNGNHDNTAVPDIGAYELLAPLDNTPPTINENPVYTVFLEANGTATITADKLLIAAFDECGILSTSVSKTSFACVDIGTVQVTLTATDRNLNVASKVIDVTVVDNLPPTFTMVPAGYSADADANACGATLTINQIGGPATATDGCGTPTITNNAPSFFPVGTTVVTWKAEDASGNIATAPQLVTVTDNTNPTITAPAAVSVNAPSTQCFIGSNLVPLGVPTVSDNCDVTYSNNAPLQYPVGVTVVTWTAMDASGNTNTAMQNVTVVDATPPVLYAPADLALISDPGSCDRDGANVTLGTPVASDNCTLASVTNDAPSIFPGGQTPVTWTATDAKGNTSTAIQIVTIFDGIAPTVVAPADFAVDADADECYWTVDLDDLGEASAGDNCLVNITATHSAGTTLSVGTHRVIWTAVDGNGNRTTDVQIVTVTGDGPTITCAYDSDANKLVKNTDPGKAGAVVTYLIPIADSECSANIEVIRTSGPGSGDFFPVGETTVSYMAIDGSNQIATCEFIVKVVDNEDPQISVAVAPRYLWPADNKMKEIEATVVVWDNVPGATAVLTSITSNQNANGDIAGATTGVFDRFFELRAKRDPNSPRTYTVLYTATDVAGNTSTASAVVTVPTQQPKDFEEEVLPAPTSLSLAQNYPNPFNPSTLITFGTPVEQHVELRVFNSMGMHVRTLVSGSLAAGSYTVEWNGLDENGQSLSSGVYLYMLRAGGEQSMKKMILTR